MALNDIMSAFGYGTDPNQPLPTLTPDSIKRKRLLAEAMLKQGMDFSPIASPWQGAARLANALVGGLEDRRLDRQEREGQASANKSIADILSREYGGGSDAAAAAPAAAASPTPSRALPAFASDVTGGINQATAKYGLDPSYLPTTAAIESNGNPSAANPNSSARGLFQFMPGTARQYGLTNPNDPGAAADAAARLALDNKKALVAALGRDPTPAELYLAHQQGAGGAAKLLANPNAPASAIVGEQAVRLNGGSPGMTAGEFAQKWLGKFSSRAGTQVASADPGFVPSPAYAPPQQAMQMPPGMGSPAPREAAQPQQPAAQPGPLPAMAGGQQAMQMPPQAAQAQAISQQIAQAAAHPQVQAAAQQAAQTPQGQQMVQQARGAPIGAIIQALSNPYMSDGQKSLLLMIAKEKMGSQYGFTTAGDTMYRTNSRTGEITPIAGVSKPMALGADQRLVDPSSGREIAGAAAQARPMSEQERVQYGVPKGVPASFDNKGNPHFGAPGVRVDMSPGSGQQVFKEVSDRAEGARAAAESLPAFQEAKRLVDSGNIILGAGADTRVAMQKFGALFGLDATAASNSEVFRSSVAPIVLGLVKGLGAGSGISNADRDFAEKAAGGNMTLEPASIKRLMDIGMRASQAKVDAHNKMIDEVYPEGDDTRQVRSLFRVTPRAYVPPEASAQPAPASAAPPQAAPAQQQQSAPVQVRTPADAQGLPPGTVYKTPDGRTFRR